jgi:MFS family permease
MAVQRRTVLQFMALYVVLFSAFGCISPFLPAFLAGRGLEPEELGLVLGAATALRLVCGPIAGRLADRLQAFRTELAVCAILAASAAILYLVTHGFWAVVAITLVQAAALAPSFRSPTLFPSPMLDQSQIWQDLNMDGCGAWARLRSWPARLWQRTRQIVSASQ